MESYWIHSSVIFSSTLSQTFCFWDSFVWTQAAEAHLPSLLYSTALSAYYCVHCTMHITQCTVHITQCICVLLWVDPCIFSRFLWWLFFCCEWCFFEYSCRICWYTDVLLLDKPSRELPRWTNGKESACQCKRHRFNPWVRKIPWRRAWQPTPIFLPGEPHGHRSLAGFSPRGPRVWPNWATTTSSEKACTNMSTSKPRIFSITVNNRKLFYKVYRPASSLQALIISWCHLTFKILPIQHVCKDISLNPFKHMCICLFIGCVGSSLLLAGFSLVVASRGYSLVTAYRLLLAVASLVAEHRLQGMDSVAVALRLSWPAHVEPSQTGDQSCVPSILTTGPPGKSSHWALIATSLTDNEVSDPDRWLFFL